MNQEYTTSIRGIKTHQMQELHICLSYYKTGEECLANKEKKRQIAVSSSGSHVPRSFISAKNNTIGSDPGSSVSHSDLRKSRDTSG